MRKQFFLVVFALTTILPILAQKEIEINEWKQIFDKYKVNGTFILYNPSTGETKIHNTERSDSAYLPASTFKILNSMIALQTKVVSNVDEIIKWDRKDRGWDEWNKDHTMRTAIPVSCVWFYKELARRIGEKRMQSWINKVGYGNTQMGAEPDNFWLEGDLRISAKQQIFFIERLINNELPFPLSIQETVKEILITDSTKNYTIHSKTGLAGDDENQTGWFVGYVEKEENNWVFALNIDVRTIEHRDARKKIVYDILKEEKIIVY